MNCQNCGKTIKYGKMCKACQNKDNPNSKSSFVPNNLTNDEMNIINKSGKWYQDNYIKHSTGIYYNYYFGDLFRIVKRITAEYSKKYSKRLDDDKTFGVAVKVNEQSPSFGISRFHRVLFYAWKDGEIPHLLEKELSKCPKLENAINENDLTDLASQCGF